MPIQSKSDKNVDSLVRKKGPCEHKKESKAEVFYRVTFGLRRLQHEKRGSGASEKKDVRLGNICLAFDGKMPMTRLLTPADYSGYSIGCLSKAKPKAIFDFLWSDSDDFWNPFLNVLSCFRLFPS